MSDAYPGVIDVTTESIERFIVLVCAAEIAAWRQPREKLVFVYEGNEAIPATPQSLRFINDLQEISGENVSAVEIVSPIVQAFHPSLVRADLSHKFSATVKNGVKFLQLLPKP